MNDSTMRNAHPCPIETSMAKCGSNFCTNFQEVVFVDQGQAPFYQFLKAARGNWRNAIYLYCSRCACPQDCGGFLMAADADGAPVLISAKAFEAMSGETVTPEECSSILHRQAFESAYALVILWRTVSSSDCPLAAFTTAGTPKCRPCKGGIQHEI